MELFVECIEENELPELFSDPKIKLNTSDNVDKNVIDHEIKLWIPEKRKRPECFRDIGAEAERLQSLLQEDIPNLKMLHGEVAKLDRMMKISGAKHDPRVKRFSCELDLLKPLIAQSKAEINEMVASVASLLDFIDSTSGHGSAVKDSLLEETENVSKENEFGDFNLNIGSMTSYPDADFSNLGNTLKKQKVYHKKPLLKRSPILQCDMCGEECKGYIRLKEHFILMHPGKRPFICPVCGRRFRKKDSIKTCQHSGKEQVEHKCKTCGEIFWSKKKLRRHKKQTHDIHAPKIPCMLCDEVFDQNRDLHNHMAIHADSGEILKCKICQRSFNKPSVLRKHLMKHSKSKTCRICGKTFMSVFSLRNHQKFHLGKFSCHLCGRFMSSTWNLKQHMKTHIRSEKTYECNVCHEKFFSPSALEFHKSSFHSIGKRHNKCPVCSKVFRSSFGRNSHLMTHTEEERTLHQAFVPMYTCIICGETMRAEYKFKHLKRHMSKAEEMFVCETCGKSFSQYSDLKLHITKHKPEEQESEDLMTEEEREFFKTLSTNNHLPCKQKPISNQRCDCDICWKNSLNKPCIGLHILANTNSDNNPILCDVCGKSFKSKTYLNTHMKLHSGNLPFQCEICRRGFLSKYSLECHLVSHLNEKPYTCHVCGIKFCSEANMQRHIKVKHEKQQQFKCEVCLKYFTTKQGLIVHKRMHTGEKPYMCDMCGHSFADPSTFYKHKASHTKKYIYAKRNFESLN